MDRPSDTIDPPELAKAAVEHWVSDGIILPSPLNPSGLLAERAAAFVTIRSSEGKLRGCIGTIIPTRPNLAEEIIQNAISAAIRDHRFPPVSPGELPNLAYGVDVLTPPEDAPGGVNDLDPFVYGVIVETTDNSHRGLLLPRIEGIDTPEDQWYAVHKKAGISPGTPVKVQRFEVRRFGKD